MVIVRDIALAFNDKTKNEKQQQNYLSTHITKVLNNIFLLNENLSIRGFGLLKTKNSYVNWKLHFVKPLCLSKSFGYSFAKKSKQSIFLNMIEFIIN